ncbi:MAG: hypothetical protein PHS02_02575 [Candidatus ainarchaeum sp.]|nr:hypothetical protein [Candidatus ainarchaeum sp.]
MDEKVNMGGVAVLGILCLLFICQFVFIPAQPEKEVNYSVFIKNLEASRKVFIVADLRNASALSRNAILQCAVDLAGSVPLAPKNVSFFVLEADSCTSTEGNTSAVYCEAIAESGTTFDIVYGNSTAYYADKIVVGIKSYDQPCSVTEVTVQNSP